MRKGPVSLPLTGGEGENDKIMFDRFTSSARKAIALSRMEAIRLCHDYIGTEHILLGLVLEGSATGTDGPSSDLEIVRVREAVERHVSQGSTTERLLSMPFSQRATKALEFTMEEADTLGHDHIGTGHVLLGLIREHDGTAVRVLLDLNIDLGRLRAEALRYLEAPERGVMPFTPRTSSRSACFPRGSC